MVILLRRRKLGKTSCEAIAAMSKTGIVCVRNDRAFPDGHDVVIRWGTTSNIPYKATVINEAKAIHWVADKSASRKIMADKGLAPETWTENFRGLAFDLYDAMIVRKRTHSQGRDLYHCNTLEQVLEATQKLGEGNYYISAYIPKVEEYRVLVGSGRAVWVAKKTPGDPNAIAWNVAQGGRFDNVRWNDWPLQAINVAVEAFLLSGLDFGGVDVMCDAEGKAYVLEINSAPSQTSPYRQECMSKFFDYIVENGKETIPVADYKSYLGVIHPAISDKARL